MPGENDARAAALVLRSLPNEVRQELEKSLLALAEELEQKGNPLVEDLLDEPTDEIAPAEHLRRLFRSVAPAFAAAGNLSAGYRSPSNVPRDRAMSVTVANRCPEASANIQCAPLFAAPKNKTWEQARFYAWAAASASVFEMDDNAAFASATERLREAMAKPESKIALITGPRILEQADELDPIRKAAGAVLERVKGRANADEEDVLRSLVDAPHDNPLTWLTGVERILYVVPKMRTLAALGEFRREVDAALSSIKVRAVTRPVTEHRP